MNRVVKKSSSRLAFSNNSECPHKWLCSTSPTNDYTAWRSALNKCRAKERAQIMRCYILAPKQQQWSVWVKFAAVVVVGVILAGALLSILYHCNRYATKRSRS